MEDWYYLYGKDVGGGDYHVRRFDLNGIRDNTVNYNLELNGSHVWDLVVSKSASDSIAFVSYEAQGTGTGITDLFYLEGGNANLINGGYAMEDLCGYKNFVYASSPTFNQLNTYSQNGNYDVTMIESKALNSNWTSTTRPLNRMAYHRTHVERDKLFFSGENLSTIDGQPVSSLSIFCLEPLDSKPFTSSDDLICEGETVTYTIPTVEYAEGYKWTYTGTGAQYRISGTVDPLQTLSTDYISDLGANSLEIVFQNGATSGDLTVEPYSTCNSSTDYIFSNNQTLPITVVPKPTISMADSTFLNCYSDTAWINFSTSTVGATPYIYRGIDTTWNDSLALDTSMLLNFGYYYGVVVEPINQCTVIDSTFFDFDLTPPSFNSSDISTSPTLFGCSTDSMEISANLAGSVVSWVYDGDTTIPLPNPFFIYSTDSMNFTATALQISNGCTADQQFQVQTDYTIATPDLVGYPNFDTQTIDDTLSCLENLLTLQCATNPPTEGTASWLFNGNETGLQNLNISEADSAGMFLNTNSFQFVTTHNLSGCKDTTDIVIYFDLNPPFIFNHAGNESLNCSQGSVLVVHQQTGGTVSEGWLDNFGQQTGSDSLIAQATGDYYYEVLDLNSGCKAADTVNIAQTFDIDVQLPLDTLICPEQIVNIVANPIINTGETPTFLWSNGSTNNSASATGGIDSELSVITQTNSGCISYDTVSVAITAPIVISSSSSTGCSSGVIQIDNISGGAGNYAYSLDNATWQSTPSFSGLNLGSHTIYVQDDLGCVYDFTEVIAPSGGTLDVNFLVSTYNETGDTIAFVNISGFTGFDSLEWVLPAGSTLLSSNDSTLLMTVDTDGWYEITLIGYLDSCNYTISKSIYFGPNAPIFNEDYEDLGITQMLIYPNPTTGTFTLEVTFGAAQNYSVQITNSSGQPMSGMQIAGSGTEIIETFTFPIGSPTGAYMIRVIGNYDAKQEMIILN